MKWKAIVKIRIPTISSKRPFIFVAYPKVKRQRVIKGQATAGYLKDRQSARGQGSKCSKSKTTKNKNKKVSKHKINKI